MVRMFELCVCCVLPATPSRFQPLLMICRGVFLPGCIVLAWGIYGLFCAVHQASFLRNTQAQVLGLVLPPSMMLLSPASALIVGRREAHPVFTSAPIWRHSLACQG